MRASSVVVLHIDPKDAIEMPGPEDQQPVQALGTLHSYPYTIAICKPDGTCRTITSFRRATFTVVPGDSGGPVFNSAAIQAIGSISATYPGSTHTIYSQIQLLELQSDATVVTN